MEDYIMPSKKKGGNKDSQRNTRNPRSESQLPASLLFFAALNQLTRNNTLGDISPYQLSILTLTNGNIIISGPDGEIEELDQENPDYTPPLHSQR